MVNNELMDLNAIHATLQAEAERRAQGQLPSSAGVSAPVANSTSPANPLASRGLLSGQPNPNTGNPAMPTAQNPNAGAISSMNGAVPNGANHIEKALIKRMMQYPIA
jgi:hypothetical protein